MHFIANWDIRLKMIAGLLWIVGILVIQKMSVLYILFAFLVVVLLTEKEITFISVKRRLKHILPFVIFMAITLALSGGIPLQRDALAFSALVCSRVLIAALVILIVMGAQSSDRLIACLAATKLPATYVTILFLMNRYVSLFLHDLQEQHKALRSRMYTPKTNPITLKNTGHVVGGLFIRAFDRSEHVYRAMKAKCFSGVIPYTSLNKINWRDIIKLVTASIFIVIAIVTNYL